MIIKDNRSMQKRLQLSLEGDQVITKEYSNESKMITDKICIKYLRLYISHMYLA